MGKCHSRGVRGARWHVDEALAEPEKRRTRTKDRKVSRNLRQRGNGGRDDQQRCVRGWRKRRSDDERLGQRDAGQVFRVDALRGDCDRLGFIARKERDGDVGPARQMSGERGTPRPGAGDEDRSAQRPKTCEIRT